MSVTFTSDNNAEDLNLANRNAALALTGMGLPIDDLYGQLAADQFYIAAARLLTLSDAGTPNVTDVNALNVMIDCGLRENYWLDAANRLMALAHGATEVTWH